MRPRATRRAAVRCSPTGRRGFISSTPCSLTTRHATAAPPSTSPTPQRCRSAAAASPSHQLRQQVSQPEAPFFRLRSLYHTFFVCFSHCLSYLTSAYGASPSATLAPSALSVCTVLRRRRRRRCSSNNGNSDVIATLCRHCCYDFTSVAHALLRRSIVV